MFSAADPPPIESGQLYTVDEVDGAPPSSLADFVGDVHLTLARNDRQFHLTGAGTPSPEGDIRFYQKNLAQHDRDIRVWSIVEQDDTFVASAFAAF